MGVEVDDDCYDQTFTISCDQTEPDIELPEFEKYVLAFIENSDFETTSTITYPEVSPYGINILFPDQKSVIGDTDCSLAVDLPSGTHVKVRLSGGIWYYRVLPEGPINRTVSK